MPHPDRDDAVSVEANPAEVKRWMVDTDHALLDDAPETVRENLPNIAPK